MGKTDITSFYTYRWRYWIGYSLIVLLLLASLFIAAFHIPGGVSSAEEQSIIRASNFGTNVSITQVPINAPYYGLQHLSLSLFGPTLLGIKLPSLILGFLTALFMILLLRMWFRANIAVLSSIIAITTGQFLLLAQEGSSAILYIFWPTVLLLLGTLIARRAKHRFLWKILFFVSAALSLYTPLSIYVLIALGSAVLLHPHLRYIARKLSRLKLLGGMIAGAIIITPLVVSCVHNPQLLLSLLGIPNSWPNLLENAEKLIGQYVGFLSFGDGRAIMPIFGLGSFLLILYGYYRLLRSRDTVQSYLILTWTILLLPILIINPVYISIMFVPLLLALATGLSALLRMWYTLFPLNPYARIAGLLPLIVLVLSLTVFGVARYEYGYRYTPDIVDHYSNDLQLLPKNPTTIVVSSGEMPLYTALSNYNKQLQVTEKPPVSGEFMTTASMRLSDRIPSHIITNGRYSDSARYYIYSNTR